MKNQSLYHNDPYADPSADKEIPELGKALPAKQEAEQSSQEKESVYGTKTQMHNDLRYTSVMKKDEDIQQDEAAKKVTEVVQRANNLLMKLTAVFPFDLFPSVITIDANKVTIIDKTFFASESVTAILLEEITDVVVESNFFLARLVITYSHHPLQPEHYAVSNLRKKEALRAQEIIQGLLVLRLSEGIDLSKLQTDEITKELSKIGKPHENIPAL